MQPDDRNHREESLHRAKFLHRAVLAGDEQAWQELYEDSFDALFRYVHWRCGGRETTTEEIVQETWLVAVRRIRHFDARQGGFQSWLRGIAANILRNHFRHANGRHRPAVELENDPAVNQPPEEHLQRQEHATRIARALAALPEHYERVLRAKYVDGRSVLEIAESKDDSSKAVESLLTRARKAFRKEYGSEE